MKVKYIGKKGSLTLCLPWMSEAVVFEKPGASVVMDDAQAERLVCEIPHSFEAAPDDAEDLGDAEDFAFSEDDQGMGDAVEEDAPLIQALADGDQSLQSKLEAALPEVNPNQKRRGRPPKGR